MSRDCDHNLVAAMVGRVSLHGYTNIVPANSQLTPAQHAVQVVALLRLLTQRGFLRPAIVKAVDLEVYLARFEPARAKVLRQEYLAAGRQPLHKYKSFLKKELLVKMIAHLSDLVTARAIQNPDPATTVALGRWWLAVGNELKRQWHAGNNVVYTSALNATQLGAAVGPWLALDDWVALENDCSRWDGRYGRACGALAIALLIWWQVPTYVWEQESCPTFRLVTLLAIFVVAFCRLSGVGNTSVINSWVNALLALLGLTRADPRLVRPFKLLVLGDDMLMLVLASNPVTKADITSAYTAYGHKPVCLVSRGQALAPTFCSGRFFLTEVGRVWAPKPGRTIAKSGWCCSTSISPRAWLRCVGLSIDAASAHVPIVRAIGRRYIELGQEPTAAESQAFAKLRSNHAPQPTGPHVATNEGIREFCAFYDTTPGEIERVEAAIRQLGYGSPLNHPLIDRIMARDIEAPEAPVDVDAVCGRDPYAAAASPGPPSVPQDDVAYHNGYYKFPDARIEALLKAEVREYATAVKLALAADPALSAHPSSRAAHATHA